MKPFPKPLLRLAFSTRAVPSFGARFGPRYAKATNACIGILNECPSR
jgi:hypothetical protein